MHEPQAEAGLKTVTEEESETFMDMIQSMLVFQPRYKVTADQILLSGWI